MVGNIQVTSRGNLCSNNWQFHVRYDHLEMDWFKDKLVLMKAMIPIHIFSGGPSRGRVDEGAGEVEGNHRGAGADLRRDVRILKGKFAQIHLKLNICGE